MKPFFHKLSKKRQKEILNSRMIVGTFLSKYRQPTWCSYPEALGGKWGCWSLMSQSIKTKKDCGKCECIKNKS